MARRERGNNAKDEGNADGLLKRQTSMSPVRKNHVPGSITYPTEKPDGSYVYVFLVDGETRYIGKGIGDRLWHHERDIIRPRKNREKRGPSAWLKFLKRSLELGRSVVVQVHSERLTDLEAKELEKRLIAETKRRHEGGSLLNFTSGGDGLSSDDARRLSNRPEVKQKLSEKSKAMWADPAMRARFIDSFKNTQNRDDVKERRRVAIKKIWSDPLKKKAWSLSIKETQNTPAVRQKKSIAIRQAQSSAVVRKKMSDAQKRNWQDEEVRNRHVDGLLAAYRRNPERRKDNGRDTIERWSDASYRAFHTERNRIAAVDKKRNTKISHALKEVWADPEHRQTRSQNISRAKSSPQQREAMRRANFTRKKIAEKLGKRYHSVTREDMEAHRASVRNSEEYVALFGRHGE